MTMPLRSAATVGVRLYWGVARRARRAPVAGGLGAADVGALGPSSETSPPRRSRRIR